MRSTGALAVGVLVLATAVFWLLRSMETGSPPPDRGPAGIEFRIPEGYTRLRLGSSDRGRASARLLEALRLEARVAAEFIEAGDRIQLLVDADADSIVEQIAGVSGTVRRRVWQGPVRERLEWGARHGDLAAPGLPPGTERNVYH